MNTTTEALAALLAEKEVLDFTRMTLDTEPPSDREALDNETQAALRTQTIRRKIRGSKLEQTRTLAACPVCMAFEVEWGEGSTRTDIERARALKAARAHIRECVVEDTAALVNKAAA